jgi:hypothetical protein
MYSITHLWITSYFLLHGLAWPADPKHPCPEQVVVEILSFEELNNFLHNLKSLL